jgi:hypothetical protein
MAARSYRTTQAGPASTNRFIVPQEPLVDVVTNLRTNAQASGAAAVASTAGRLKLDTGSGDGFTPDATPSKSRGMNQALADMATAATISKVAGYVGIAAPGPIGMVASGVAIGASALSRAADVQYSNMRVDKEESTKAARKANEIGFFSGVTQDAKNFINSPIDYTVNEIKTGVSNLEDDLTALGRGAAAIPGKVAVGAQTLAVNLGLAQSRNATGPASRATKDPINERATRAERSSVSKANQEAVDLRAAKEAAQAERAASVAAANARGRNSNVGNRSSSTSSTRNSGFSGGSAVDFGGGNTFSSDF